MFNFNVKLLYFHFVSTDIDIKAKKMKYELFGFVFAKTESILTLTKIQIFYKFAKMVTVVSKNYEPCWDLVSRTESICRR